MKLFSFALSLLFIIVFSSLANADRSRVRFVVGNSPYIEFQQFSSDGTYLASLSNDTDSIEFMHYSREKRNYEVIFSIPYYSPEYRGKSICRVNNSGEFIIFDQEDYKNKTYDKTGAMISSVDVKDDCEGVTPSRQHLESTKAELKSILCSIPANFRPNGIADVESKRITDITAIRARLPGGYILADVSTRPILAKNVIFGQFKFDAVAMIKPGTENYCILASLTSTSPENCGLSNVDYSTPFLTRYDLHLNENNPSKECTFTLTQKNNTKLEAKSTGILVEWLQGEYSDIVPVSHLKPTFSAIGVSSQSITFDVSQGCGHLISVRSSNPRLRSTAFGIGDIYCSHY